MLYILSRQVLMDHMIKYWVFNAKLCYLHSIGYRDTAVLHYANDILRIKQLTTGDHDWEYSKVHQIYLDVTRNKQWITNICVSVLYNMYRTRCWYTESITLVRFAVDVLLESWWRIYWSVTGYGNGNKRLPKSIVTRISFIEIKITTDNFTSENLQISQAKLQPFCP